MQNRIICVKCSADGELPPKRKALLAVCGSHPLQQRLWHPVCEGSGVLLAGDTDDGSFLFSVNGRR